MTRSMAFVWTDDDVEWDVLAKHTPGGHDHNQEDHGNWADGERGDGREPRNARPQVWFDAHRQTAEYAWQRQRDALPLAARQEIDRARESVRGLARRAITPDRRGFIPTGGSEVLAIFFDLGPDAEANLAGEFDLDTVTPAMRDQGRRSLYAASQRMLRARGFGDTITVYRGGGLYRPDTVTPVSFDPYAAQKFADHYGTRTGIFHEYTIPRSKVLADVGGLLQSYGFESEAELLVYAKDLQALVGLHKGSVYEKHTRLTPDERLANKLTRRETPRQRKQRIQRKRVSPETLDAMRRLFGIRPPRHV